MFFGREYEAGLLREAIASNRAELCIVYGRRRIGKSTLVRRVQPDSEVARSLYFEGLQGGSQKSQIAHFLNRFSEQSGAPLPKADSWDDAFKALTWYLENGRHYVVLDEFPWMAQGKTELVSLLKYYWDNHWKSNAGVTLVICGSIANFMFRHIVHSKALHNRKTLEIKLPPLSGIESAPFFQDKRSRMEMARFLFVFGGVPKYLEQIRPERTLAENMDRLCFQRSGFFVNEFETIFKEQFRVTHHYERIVRELATRSHSRQSLARALGIEPGGGLSSYIHNLEQADFVETFGSLPIGGSRSRTKRIVLWDEWLRFFFTYIEPNKSAIKLNTKRGLFRRLAAESFDTYCGLAFERFCIKNLPMLLDALGIGLEEVVRYGPFFRQPQRSGKNRASGMQVDLLIELTGDVLLLVECKFTKRAVGKPVISEVERKIELLNAPKRYTVERVLVSAAGATRELEKARYFHRICELDELFSASGDR